MSHFGEFGQSIKLADGLTYKRLPWAIRVLTVLIHLWTILPRVKAVVHLGTDGYNDAIFTSHWWSLLSICSHSYQLIVSRMFRKPVVMLSVTVGPFNSRFTRWLARTAISGVQTVAARENSTLEHLRGLDIPAVSSGKTTLIPVADLAFLVEQADEQTVEKLLKSINIPPERPLVGIVPSQSLPPHLPLNATTLDKRKRYVITMSQVANAFASKGAEVIILCQTTSDKYDDRSIAKKIAEACTKHPMIITTADISIQAMKGVMQHCRLLVSSKMHSTVLAASTGTPCVTLAYALKVQGIIGDMLGLEKYIVPLNGTDYLSFESRLSETVERCWSEHEQLRANLLQRMPAIQSMAVRNIDILARLLTGNEG